MTMAPQKICATCGNAVTSTIGVLIAGEGARVVGFCDTCCAPEKTEEPQLGHCSPRIALWLRDYASGKISIGGA